MQQVQIQTGVLDHRAAVMPPIIRFLILNVRLFGEIFHICVSDKYIAIGYIA